MLRHLDKFASIDFGRRLSAVVFSMSVGVSAHNIGWCVCTRLRVSNSNALGKQFQCGVSSDSGARIESSAVDPGFGESIKIGRFAS